MFDFKKKNKEVKNLAEKQYAELLKQQGIKDINNKDGFILGEKKEIYDSETSLEDIINNHLYN